MNAKRMNEVQENIMYVINKLRRGTRDKLIIKAVLEDTFDFLTKLKYDEKQADWVKTKDYESTLYGGSYYFRCTNCDETALGGDEYEYCPHCGAKMNNIYYPTGEGEEE